MARKSSRPKQRFRFGIVLCIGGIFTGIAGIYLSFFPNVFQIEKDKAPAIGKRASPTDAKRSLRARQAPGDDSPLAHQPVACHPPWKGRGVVLFSQGSPGKGTASQRVALIATVR